MWADPRLKKAPAVRRCIAHGARSVGVSPDSPERRKRDASKRIGTAFRLGAAAGLLLCHRPHGAKPAGQRPGQPVSKMKAEGYGYLLYLFEE